MKISWSACPLQGSDANASAPSLSSRAADVPVGVRPGPRRAGSDGLAREAESHGRPVPSGTVALEETSWDVLIFTAFQGFLSLPKSRTLGTASRSCGKELRGLR